ncbi:LOW QUALITY PROTEIN: plakophilin-1-like [Xyrichtys novacula]|uniref:LOW QUALITY PROTEIN: plakophilin-1-like n=1 Tax=Xyrichtys novacula TaxID=13765 RepID=A0AAV1HHQ1_XYRNO|nr:LOW QUALITY PROTEIN: plakophilin-1-like [Xyrichtys novacula]
MMPPEPLRSAMTMGSAEDTSLAIPSDHSLRLGQQRVLDQVHTIKRSKSRTGKNGTPTSPIMTSPQSSTMYEFSAFKFTPSKAANGHFSRTNSTLSTGFAKSFNTQRGRTMNSKAMGSRHVSTSGVWEQQVNTSAWPKGPNGLKPSRSDPALAPPFTAAPAPIMRAKGQTVASQQTLQTRVNRHSSYSMTNGNAMTTSQTRIVRPASALSQTEGKMGTLKVTKLENMSGVNSSTAMSDLTLKEAVEFLTHLDENYQQCGATFIQHTTFKEESAKQEVYQLGGIPHLVTLLRSPHPGVSQAAAGALRNLVFRDHNNKLEVQHCSGIGKALQLLKETESTETQKQITGLLWNLSSADELKGELIATALPALTENVVVPFTSWSDSSTNNNIHPDVFHSATGCLRNLSCAQQKERQAMRECPGLIDSIMSYVQSCVAEENPDDKSVENCACILHNLTYQLETESPQCFSKFQSLSESYAESKKNSTVGCFSPKSSKAQKEFAFDVARGLPEDPNPTGVKWLCHPKAMQTYLSLLGSSQKDATLEACCGALQNLTASKGVGSSVMSQILVQKLGALMHMSPLLSSPNRSLQKTALSLLGNMSRTSSLQNTMAKQILPGLTSLLSSSPRDMGNSDETIATTCSTVRSLMMADPEVTKKAISGDLVRSLADLSENGSFPKGSKAASLLLYSLWNEKGLQGAVKKLGLGKSLFVNDNTTAVHRLAQVIE